MYAGDGAAPIHCTVSRSSRASPASSLTRLGGSGRCSGRGGSGRRRSLLAEESVELAYRRWFHWRARSRVGVAECECGCHAGCHAGRCPLASVSVRKVCVCACEREAGCVRELLVCVVVCFELAVCRVRFARVCLVRGGDLRMDACMLHSKSQNILEVHVFILGQSVHSNIAPGGCRV